MGVGVAGWGVLWVRGGRARHISHAAPTRPAPPRPVDPVPLLQPYECTYKDQTLSVFSMPVE